MPDAAKSPEESLKESRKKKKKANAAQREDVFWGVYHTALLGGIGVALFFLFPHVALLAFVAITLVTGFVTYTTGILGDPIRNLRNLKKHNDESQKAGKGIVTAQKSIEETRAKTAAEQEKKQADVEKSQAEAKKAKADARMAEVEAKKAERAAAKAGAPGTALDRATAEALTRGAVLGV